MKAEIESTLAKDYSKDTKFNKVFDCKSSHLISLKGCPKQCKSFDCSYNSLTSLEYGPKVVKGNYICYNNKLTTLKGCAEKVSGEFDCGYNQLTTLEGCPKEVGGDFNCCCNKLITLKECPEKVNGEFDCDYNQLITLEGCPKEVSGNFLCCDNQLITLKGCPEYVGRNFNCNSNYDLEDISDLPSMVEKVDIYKCHNIKIFTKEITNEKGTLTFYHPDYEVRERIKSWSYYEVVEEDSHYNSITVKIKNDNELFMEAL